MNISHINARIRMYTYVIVADYILDLLLVYVDKYVYI